MEQNTPRENKQVKKLEYGQPARRIADDDNPVQLGEEKGSYADQIKRKQESSEGRTNLKTQ